MQNKANLSILKIFSFNKENIKIILKTNYKNIYNSTLILYKERGILSHQEENIIHIDGIIKNI